MLMDNETIVTLYREALDNGDPKEIINSMAKTNGCSPEEIRQILDDAGELYRVRREAGQRQQPQRKNVRGQKRLLI